MTAKKARYWIHAFFSTADTVGVYLTEEGEGEWGNGVSSDGTQGRPTVKWGRDGGIP